ncbi:hypothetical protein HS1genome_1601 [Sulfodiicoccus acidiphilus]|uniref:NADP-dependent oxidoreductase domain-containing protein n=1 Tax=Sulfodiicoccus acidiphilus TaxID=1670455 RepID=A0A348B4W0_9CREN|nr:aldo/keto reductase [Sulfodiicoccus acidiphilus]BBD73212.1 hypothetical protein HS1genome_1601 [Sulfodiicoccus acidiphilus]GGU04891.1 hypothetical protein GCM10007116_21850 [Sulfodiicoccus acidiphilus]
MIPFCMGHGIAYMPYFSTAVGILRGRFFKDGKTLVGPNDPGRIIPTSNFYAYKIYVEPPKNGEIVRRTMEVAKKRGVTSTQVALAWLFHRGVTSPIIRD